MLIGRDSLRLTLSELGVPAEARTLVHVGAHLAEEHDLWVSLGFRSIVYVEAIPELAASLRARFSDDPSVRVLQAVVSERSGERAAFRINTPTYTSSLLELTSLTTDTYPEIERHAELEVLTVSLEDLLASASVSPSVLVIDVQGSEGAVLSGLGCLWESIDLLIVECQHQTLYEGALDDADLLSLVRRHGLFLIDSVKDRSGLWSDAAFSRTTVTAARASHPQRGWRNWARSATRSSPAGAAPIDVMAIPRRNAYSQFGEDGLLRSILPFVTHGQGVVVDVGAWDGIYLSNTRLLVEAGWRAFYVEADRERASSILRLAHDPTRVQVVAERVGPDGKQLSTQLDLVGCPSHVDLLSVDIDSDDLAVFEDFATSRTASVVVIEYNPTIPTDVLFRNSPGHCFGNSFALIQEVLYALDYVQVAWTEVNQVFVHSSCDSHFIEHRVNRPGYLVGHSRLFWGYDGSLFDVELGTAVAPPHDALPSDHVAPLWGQGVFPQPVPENLRRFPTGK